ncbi:MAG TPA: YqgE/AlgH family protein [Gammaproteobacteria bacterium]|nr:YqgE/AlgH family protein [Gammaproteobacteria bacterium]
MSDEGMHLGGQLLLAMPALADPNFYRSVVLVCEHGDEGALGLIVNRPMQLELGEVLAQLDMTSAHEDINRMPVFSGGPVETQRGFVIHDDVDIFADSMNIGDSLAISSSSEILSAISKMHGPDHFMVVLGYAGWGPGQLENELRENAWLSVPASSRLIFDVPVNERWRRAAIQIGVDPLQLSSESGQA